MISITLSDGSVKEVPMYNTPIDVAKSISSGLARNVLSESFNGETVESVMPITEDGSLVLYTWSDEQGKPVFWHSSSNILAQAIEEMYPGVKLTIGPPIETGFYYDIDMGEHTISEKDFPAIEKRMLEIAREKHEFKMRAVNKQDALDYYKEKGNEFKIELIENLEDETINFY